MAKPAKKVVKEVLTANEKLDKELAELGLSSVLGMADEFHSSYAYYSPTSIPSLDALLGGQGMAHSRDVEIFSKDGSAAKTTIALQIVAEWQLQGKVCGIVDIEGTITVAYLNLLGVITDRKLCPPGITAVRMISHRREDGKAELLTLQSVFNTLQKCGDTFDLLVVDSVDAMMEKNEAEKTADENAKQGGIAKRMSEFMRKNVARKATIIWLNQMRQSMGYNPSGGITYVSSGGRALRFYASIRLELAFVKKLEEADKDPWGFTIEVRCVKNKLGPQWRKCELTYIFGEGISKVYDYQKIAIAKGIVVKNKAWLKSEELGINVQGEHKLYQKLKANVDGCFDKLRSLIDGEDVIDLGEVDMETKLTEEALAAADAEANL